MTTTNKAVPSIPPDHNTANNVQQHDIKRGALGLIPGYHFHLNELLELRDNGSDTKELGFL